MATLRWLLVVVVASAVGGVVAGASPAAAAPAPVVVVVPGTAGGDGHGGTPPVATGITLGPNEALVVTATGTVYLGSGNTLPNDPNGGNGGFFGFGLVPFAPPGCLAARVGTGAWHCIGAGPAALTGSGEVQLAVNDGFIGGLGEPGYLGNSGQFAVTMRATGVPVNTVVPGTAGGDGHGGTPPVATGIVLGPNEALVVTATGTVYLGSGNTLPNGPNGGNGGYFGFGLVPFAPPGCLAARVGTGAWHCIGAGPTALTGSGAVQLAVNDGFIGGLGEPGYSDNSGQFAVKLVEGTTYPPDLALPMVTALTWHHHHH